MAPPDFEPVKDRRRIDIRARGQNMEAVIASSYEVFAVIPAKITAQDGRVCLGVTLVAL
jgi:hypothetical protein